MRTGIVLSSYGGMLAKILPIFKLGLGGKIGSGDQYISWIALDDVLTTILYAITNDSIIGPINAVSPNPVTYILHKNNWKGFIKAYIVYSSCFYSKGSIWKRIS